jgi:hypothetical protein
LRGVKEILVTRLNLSTKVVPALLAFAAFPGASFAESPVWTNTGPISSAGETYCMAESSDGFAVQLTNDGTARMAFLEVHFDQVAFDWMTVANLSSANLRALYVVDGGVWIANRVASIAGVSEEDGKFASVLIALTIDPHTFDAIAEGSSLKVKIGGEFFLDIDEAPGELLEFSLQGSRAALDELIKCTNSKP